MISRVPRGPIPAEGCQQTAPANLFCGDLRKERAPLSLAHKGIDFGHECLGQNNVGSQMSHIYAHLQWDLLYPLAARQVNRLANQPNWLKPSSALPIFTGPSAPKEYWILTNFCLLKRLPPAGFIGLGQGSRDR